MTPEVLLPKLPYSRLERTIIESQLIEGENVFANGETANNHLDMGFNEVPESLRQVIAIGLGDLVIANEIIPAFIAGVPSGANGWAQLLTNRLKNEFNPALLSFRKVSRRKFANYPHTTKKVEQLIEDYGKPEGIVIDDASSDGGTGEAMADFLTEQGLEITLVLSVFYRGDLDFLRTKYRRGALMARTIPLMMDWKAYREDGIIQPLSPTR